MWSLATRKHARRRVLAGASRVESAVDQRYFSTHATPTETRAARPKPKRAVPRVRARSKRRPASPAHPETHTSELTQALESEGGGACPLQFGRDEVRPRCLKISGQRFGELVGQTHCVSNLINWTYSRLPRVPPPELASTGRIAQPRGPAMLRVPSHPVLKPVGCGAEGREALTIGTGTRDRATEGARAGWSVRPVSPHGCRLPPRRGPP